MSFVTAATGVAAWGIRGAATGLGIDLGYRLAGRRIDFRNLAINLIHGLAIGLIGAAFGTPAAVGAFIASTLILIPAVVVENANASRQRLTESFSVRTIALLFGSAIGSLL